MDADRRGDRGRGGADVRGHGQRRQEDDRGREQVTVLRLETVMSKTKWLRLILAGYATLLLAGLATLGALRLLEPLAMHWTVFEVAIALGLALMITLALGGDEKPRR